ncbi:MAG: hypothetical protein RLZZ511_520 [Cyanobacteriota bacterium]|jgi:2-oxo-4-hydroxy-4-carboxy-5-ureidoimidazoline decarboxylase
MIAIAQVNQLNQAEFVELFGFVFEQTPEIAAQAWLQRPFINRAQLHKVMAKIVQGLSATAQIQLICAHPDLGSRLAMAAVSVQEQSGVGLDRLTAAEYDRFHRLNERYKQCFGFPFIIAVRNHTKESILAAFEQRLGHDRETEQSTAIQEIIEIARLRLADRIASGDRGSNAHFTHP